MMKNSVSVLASVVIVLAAAIAAEAAEIAQSIIFEKGKSSALVQNSVVRGARDVYTLRVRAGQKLSVSLTAIESNAAFSIYAPKSEVPHPGTEEENDVTSWQGTTQMGGTYRIVVGGTRGNATYKLRVSVK